METLEKIIISILLLAVLATLVFVGYEYRGMVDCNKHTGYSYQYSKCVKVTEYVEKE